MDLHAKRLVSAEMARAAIGLDSRPATPSPKVSRRQFIASLGALTGGVAHAAELSSCVGGELSVCRVSQSGVAVERQALEVRLAGATWTIDPALFGSKASLRHVVSVAEGRHAIRLRDAVFAGTSLTADFSASLFRSRGAWSIRLQFEETGRELDFPLLDWIATPAPGAQRPIYAAPLLGNERYIAIGQERTALTPVSGNIEFALDATFGVRLRAVSGLAFSSGHFDFLLQAARIVPAAALEPGNPHGAAVGAASGPFSLIDFDVPTALDHEVKLGQMEHKLTVHLRPGGALQASMVGFVEGKRPDATFMLQGPGSGGALVLRGGAAGPGGARIGLADWAVAGTVNRLRENLSFAAGVAPAAPVMQATETDTMAVYLSGLSGEAIQLDLSSSTIPPFGFHAKLGGAHVPVPGASSAHLSFPGRTVWVNIGKELPAPAPGGIAGRLHIGGRGSKLEMNLDQALLRLRRSADNLDLGFELVHYDLRVEDERSSLVQRMVPKILVPGQPAVPCMVAHFAPQHEFEEVFDADEATKPTQNGEPARRPLSSRRPDLARTLLADGSRLAFDLPFEPRVLRPLTIEWLTDWGARKLRVDRRALPRSAGLEEQLRLLGDTANMDRQAAIKAVIDTINGLHQGAPGPYETAIEPVYRLVISPDCSARFAPNHAAPDPVSPMQWQVELINEAEVATRVLQARGLVIDDKFFGPKGKAPQAAYPQPFRGSLEHHDRRELAAQTAYFGMGALRRLQEITPPVPFKQLKQAKQRLTQALAACDPNKKWQDDPAGMVFLPAQPPAYLSGKKVCGERQEGIMVARPFDRFRLRMGRAADVDACWKGEPAAPLQDDEFFNPAFRVERYSHRTVQGRDVFVEVVYKGFLFPLGHRATYLKVSYRDYRAYLDDPLGDPTAYLIQEFHIVCNKPEKHYGAYDQPYDSRDFPCNTVTLVTQKTGRLADAALSKVPTARGLAFWPASEMTGQPPIIFDYRIDGQPDVASSQLLFVDNAAAHDAASMAAIVDYYNRLNGNEAGKRTVRHGNTVRRYAPENKRGDCSYKTDTWLLAARGRLPGVTGAENYEMDAFMEGQDQPPYYPVVEQALVNIAPVERLTGQRGIYVKAAFNSRFVLHGFDGQHNPSEIFLDILTPGLELNGSQSGGATGGVATMAAVLAGMSRKIGPVGGQPRGAAAQTKALLARAGAKAAAAASITQPGGGAERPADMSAALAGTFSPFEFLGDAKLLGCIPLKEVCQAAMLSAAPRVLEEAEHGIQTAAKEAAAAYEQIRALLAAALDAASGAVQDCRTEAANALQKMGQGLTLEALYPSLANALQNVQDVCKRGTALLDPQRPAPELAALQALASELRNAADQLVHELESIARDPVPSIIRDTLQKLQSICQGMRDPFRALAKAFADYVVDLALNALLDTLCQPPNQYLLNLILGRGATARAQETPVQLKERLRQLLSHPSDAIREMRDALLYEAFSKPLFQLLQLLAGAQQKAGTYLAWSRQRVIVIVTGAIRGSAAAIPAERLMAVGEAVAGRIDASLQAGTALAELPKTIAEALDQERQNLKTLLSDLVDELCMHATEAQKNIAQYLIEEAKAKVVTPAMEQAYRELLVTARRAQDAYEDAHDVYQLVQSANWERLRGQLAAGLKAEFDRAIAEAVREAQLLARETADDAMNRAIALANQLLATLDRWALLTEIQAMGKALGDICQAGAQKLKDSLAVVSFMLVPDANVIDTKLVELDALLQRAFTELDLLVLPAGAADARATALGTLSTLSMQVGAVRQLASDTATALAQCKKQLGACSIPAILPALDRAAALRARVPQILLGALDAAQRCLDTMPALAAAQAEQAALDALADLINEASTRLLILLGDLSGLAKIAASLPAWRNHRLYLEQLTAGAITDLSEKFDTIEALAKIWSDQGRAALERGRMVQAEFEQLDRYLTGVVVQLLLPADGFIAPLQTAMLTVANKAAGALLTPHDSALAAVAGLRTLLANGDTGAALSALLSPQLHQQLVPAEAALAMDRNALQELSTLADKNTLPSRVRALASRWRSGKSGIAHSGKLVADVVRLVTSGNVMQLFNVADIEARLRAAVASFIPTRIGLSYDFDTSLADFPSGQPVFSMDRANFGTISETSYDGRFPRNDLVLSTRVEVDLMTGKRSVKADGKLRPFTLHLLGSLDLVSISFAGAHFQSTPGGKLRIDTAISGVRIGAMLEFLTLIQNYFSSGPENGLYYEARFLPPALEVGYRYNQPLIIIGNMQLLNIGFRVGARLPLDDRPAEFFAQLSSREYPLLIAMPPYGGGGFFALTANARNITSFEIQLEFGFVGALSIGPLAAQARATAGIYLKQGNGIRVLEGFFHALGEGHIGCFGIGVNIEIRMRQENGGAMVGSSTYSYSFRVGFFKIRFKVVASRRQGNGSGSSGSSGSSLSGSSGNSLAPASAASAPCGGAGLQPVVRTLAPHKTRQWREYKRHFDL